MLLPQDESGMPDLAAILGQPKPDTLIYCCGPEGLISAATEICKAWPKGALHVERFSPIAMGAPVLSGSFEVVLAQSGRTLIVPPEKSILDVLMEAGVPALSACGEGTCGTCEKIVLEGIPDHRDSLLDDEERALNDRILVCVSRSLTSRLVLDV
jgi:ferredoxin